MASKNNDASKEKVAGETKETETSKLEVAEKTLKAQREKEANKQKKIYRAMNDMVIIRN